MENSRRTVGVACIVVCLVVMLGLVSYSILSNLETVNGNHPVDSITPTPSSTSVTALSESELAELFRNKVKSAATPIKPVATPLAVPPSWKPFTDYTTSTTTTLIPTPTPTPTPKPPIDPKLLSGKPQWEFVNASIPTKISESLFRVKATITNGSQNKEIILEFSSYPGMSQIRQKTNEYIQDLYRSLYGIK
jgi:hypothetical protein